MVKYLSFHNYSFALTIRFNVKQQGHSVIDTPPCFGFIHVLKLQKANSLVAISHTSYDLWPRDYVSSTT
jgi:hypothetical protein